MPTKDRQKLITELVSQVLKEPAKTDVKFEWFINTHEKPHFKESYHHIEKIFIALNGQVSAKAKRALQCDAYFSGKYNFMFEFDELQHFSTFRLKTFEYYPKGLKLNYSLSQWKEYCQKYSSKADKYRNQKMTTDFNFEGGRTCQRAYLDTFRDFLPSHNGLNPTLRIADFEVAHITEISTDSVKFIKKLIENKINH